MEWNIGLIDLTMFKGFFGMQSAGEIFLRTVTIGILIIDNGATNAKKKWNKF